MSAIKPFSKRALAVAVAAAALGLAAMSAQANLQWRVTDVVLGETFTVCDNNIGVGCLALGDLNPALEVITVDTALLNGLLTGKFDFTAAGADDNILTAVALAVINSSFQVQVTTNGAGLLVVEATRDGWLIPLGNPRTLTNGPSATLTETAGTVTSQGFNDPTNTLFGTAGAFATPTSTFTAGVGPECSPIVGAVSTCSDLQQLGGINEANPYSLTNVQTVSSPAGDAPATYLVTDSSTKFGSQQVPEPTSLLLLGAGLAALGFGRRRKTA